MTNKIPPHNNKGNLIIVSDLHGNYKDYQKYLHLWNHKKPDNHIVFLGDLIHSTNKNDGSIKILDDAINKTKQYPNFHVLLGNHEWAHITNTDIYKDGQNQRKQFEELVKQEKKENAYETMQKYMKFFKSLPLFLKTSNGLFLSHAGPSPMISWEDSLTLNKMNSYSSCICPREYKLLEAMLWNRPENYDEKDIDTFLGRCGSNFMVVGHTPVEAYQFYGKQLILSSSFQTKQKCYLEVDLNASIDNKADVKNCIRTL